MRALEYLITTAMVLAFAYIIVTPIVNHVAQTMDDSANQIAEASRTN
jgi:H+/gluconate symporter-like permease